MGPLWGWNWIQIWVLSFIQCGTWGQGGGSCRNNEPLCLSQPNAVRGQRTLPLGPSADLSMFHFALGRVRGIVCLLPGCHQFATFSTISIIFSQDHRTTDSGSFIPPRLCEPLAISACGDGFATKSAARGVPWRPSCGDAVRFIHPPPPD